MDCEEVREVGPGSWHSSPTIARGKKKAGKFLLEGSYATFHN